jgi:DNA-binding NarL/FixJ family response regulator
MLVLVQANILTVGLEEKTEALKELPIRIINMQQGKTAARSLKNQNFDSVVSTWNVEDMPNGEFLKRLKTVKPNIPTIVLVESGNKQQEIDARSTGANAVLPEDTNDDLFRETLVNVLGLKGKIDIKSISPLKQNDTKYEKVHQNEQ